MDNKIKLMALPLIFLLSACGGGDDDSSGSGGSSGEGIGVVTISGGTQDLTGDWKTACYTENVGTSAARDIQETLTFSSTGTVEYSSNTFTTSDASCSDGASLLRGYTATVVTTGTQAISKWLNGSNELAVAPTAQDGSSALSDNESFTGLDYTLQIVANLGNIQVGDKVQMGYVVDDTGSQPMMYRVDNKRPQPSDGLLFDPFTKI